MKKILRFIMLILVMNALVLVSCGGSSGDGNGDGTGSNDSGNIGPDGECIEHTVATDPGYAATCTEPGMTDGEYCSVCGEVLAEKTVISPLKHDRVAIPAVEPTCTSVGYTEGKSCSRCPSVFIEPQKVAKLPHTYGENDTCSCGKVYDPEVILVLSQNIRLYNDGNGNDIVDRAPRFEMLVDLYSPDLMGIQEPTLEWMEEFRARFGDEYGILGCSFMGHDSTDGEWNPILYRLDRFEVVDSGTFWLTDTPDQVSVVEGALDTRICTWAILTDKLTGKTFVFANTHLDHTDNDEVRITQAGYLLDNLADKIEQYPFMITGDFNTTPTSNSYKEVVKVFNDARVDATDNLSTDQFTFDAYGIVARRQIIDYIFYNDKVTANWYRVAYDKFGGFISDHYGIFTEFKIQ